MATGKVKFFNDTKGYGFIAQDDGPDLFVHKTGLQVASDLLSEGDAVMFDVADGREPGKKKAINVTLI